MTNKPNESSTVTNFSTILTDKRNSRKEIKKLWQVGNTVPGKEFLLTTKSRTNIKDGHIKYGKFLKKSMRLDLIRQAI